MEQLKSRRGKGTNGAGNSKRGKILPSSRSKRQGKKRINLSGVLNICKTKLSCLDWLQSHVLFPKSAFCPRCGMKMMLEEREDHLDGYMWICHGQECVQDPPTRAVRDSTWFATKDLPLVDILLITYFWSAQIEKSIVLFEINMSQRDYDEWDNFFKRICEKVRRSEAFTSNEACHSGIIQPCDDVSWWYNRNKTSDPFMELLHSADAVCAFL